MSRMPEKRVWICQDPRAVTHELIPVTAVRGYFFRSISEALLAEDNIKRCKRLYKKPMLDKQRREGWRTFSRVPTTLRLEKWAERSSVSTTLLFIKCSHKSLVNYHGSVSPNSGVK